MLNVWLYTVVICHISKAVFVYNRLCFVLELLQVGII